MDVTGKVSAGSGLGSPLEIHQRCHLYSLFLSPLSFLHLSVSQSAPPSLDVPPPCFPDGEKHHKQIQAGGKKGKKALLFLPLPYLGRSFCLSGSEIGTGDQFESILKGEVRKKEEGVNEGGGGGVM